MFHVSSSYQGMQGSIIPVAVAHGEGRAEIPESLNEIPESCKDLVCLQYTKPDGEVASGTAAYPYNPNGSPGGFTGFTSPCGRFLAMMPRTIWRDDDEVESSSSLIYPLTFLDPERLVRNVANTWKQSTINSPEYGPWIQLFINARQWCDES